MKGRPRAVLALLAVGGLAVALWPVVIAMTAGVPVVVSALTAHVAGMLAGYGVLVMMTLMSRWPVLELGVGADRLARWHSAGGRIVLSLVIVHALAAVQAWASSRGVWFGAAFVQVLGLPWLVSATVATALMIVVAVASVRAARRRMPYERWHAVHLLAYLAIALSFLHQLAGPDLTGHLAVQILWALLYTLSFALVLRYRFIEPVRAATHHRLRVVEITDEAPGVVSLVLAGRHLDELRAEPGQFFRWRFVTPDTWLTAYPFSLSAPPTSDRLRLTVKALGDGTSKIQGVEVGTWVAAEGPYGAMTAARRTRRDVALIAGGVGITPLRALFETLPVDTGQDLVLLYRANNRENIVFRTELDTLAAQRRARVIYLLGTNPDLLTASSLGRLVPNLAERDVYLCGPPGMSSAVRESLQRLGLPNRQLHEERFAF